MYCVLVEVTESITITPVFMCLLSAIDGLVVPLVRAFCDPTDAASVLFVIMRRMALTGFALMLLYYASHRRVPIRILLLCVPGHVG